MRDNDWSPKSFTGAYGRGFSRADVAARLVVRDPDAVEEAAVAASKRARQ